MWKEIELLIAELVRLKISKVTRKVTNRTASFIGWFLMTIVLMILLMFALSFIALAITFLLAEVMPLWGAALIMVGVFLLELLLIYVFREPIFIRPVRRRLRQMIDDAVSDEM